jgi:hypothetical protein
LIRAVLKWAIGIFGNWKWFLGLDHRFGQPGRRSQVAQTMISAGFFGCPGKLA